MVIVPPADTLTVVVVILSRKAMSLSLLLLLKYRQNRSGVVSAGIYRTLRPADAPVSIFDGWRGSLLVFLLLLSISEFIGFSWAYLITAAASTALITWYCRFFLGGGARTLMIGAGLAGVYTFLYITLRQQDYALLMGAIALCARNGNVRDAQSRLVRARCWAQSHSRDRTDAD